MRGTRRIRFAAPLGIAVLLGAAGARADHPVVDTAQDLCWDDAGVIACPQPAEPFHGQDSHYAGSAPAYVDPGDGTITDLVTGLVWQKTPDLQNKSTWAEAAAGAGSFELAGHQDWRLPTVKELYSLIDFRGSSVSQPPVAYLDTAYFDFVWGDTTSGERLIDAQYWSATEYVGLTMNGDATVFGVNFADGRIKGYPRDTGPGGQPFTAFVRYVRGGDGYGTNDLVDNGDGTVTDLATGLMWQQTDDGVTRNWEEALSYAEGLILAGHDDWRLPNAKELQSIVDYGRAPDAQDPAQQGPAIDPIFAVTETESYFWTGTTLDEVPADVGRSDGIYIAFGQAWGYMFGQWLNVHGAGAQRSDPKSGNPDDFPFGRGPQGDEVRIDNYVRAVRDAGAATGTDLGGGDPGGPLGYVRAFPSPGAAAVTLECRVPAAGRARLAIHDVTGRLVARVVHGGVTAGTHRWEWSGRAADGRPVPGGVYLVRLDAPGVSETAKILRVR